MSEILLRSAPITAELEFRATAEGTPEFRGYAAVFDSPSKPIRDRAFAPSYVETVRPGAFKRSLNSKRRMTFVVDHDDTKLIASTESQRLGLSEDDHGMHVQSAWPATSYTDDARALFEAGEPLTMSFSFAEVRDGTHWSPDKTQRELSDVMLHHVTVLTGPTPAYNETTAAIRSLAERVEADVDDLEKVLDALNQGEELDEGGYNLLVRMVETVRPTAIDAPVLLVPVDDWKSRLEAKGIPLA